MKKLVVLLGLLSALSAHAGVVYVGSFNVSDGPYWGDTPPVYSGRTAAAVIFGGLFSDYAISIDPSRDPASITHSAHYDGVGDHSDRIFNEDFTLDLGGHGYGSFPGADPTASAYSAYVNDGISANNYVWKVTVSPVPETSTYALLLAGLGLLAATTFTRKRT